MKPQKPSWILISAATLVFGAALPLQADDTAPSRTTASGSGSATVSASGQVAVDGSGSASGHIQRSSAFQRSARFKTGAKVTVRQSAGPGHNAEAQTRFQLQTKRQAKVQTRTTLRTQVNATRRTITSLKRTLTTHTRAVTTAKNRLTTRVTARVNAETQLERRITASGRAKVTLEEKNRILAQVSGNVRFRVSIGGKRVTASTARADVRKAEQNLQTAERAEETARTRRDTATEAEKTAAEAVVVTEQRLEETRTELEKTETELASTEQAVQELTDEIQELDDALKEVTESEETVVVVVDAPPDTPPENVFGYDKPVWGCFEGQVMFIEPNAQKLPTDYSKYEVQSRVYACEWDIPERRFEDGFPGVTDRFEWFAIRYQGTFRVTRPGTYTFRTHSDDGTKLYINGNLVVDNDGAHPPRSRSGSVTLAAGENNLVLEYFQGPRYHIALQVFVTPEGGVEELFSVRD